METTAVASVSVTLAPLIDGEPASATAVSEPPDGVFFTAKALLARFAAAARVSLKATTSVAPSTVAPVAVGAVASAARVTTTA